MARRQGGFRNALRDLSGALVPLSARGLGQEIAERVSKIPTRLNEYGFDQFGMEPAATKSQLLFCALLYRYYFRVATRGIEKVPPGRVLLISTSGEGGSLVELRPRRTSLGEMSMSELVGVVARAAQRRR